MQQPRPPYEPQPQPAPTPPAPQPSWDDSEPLPPSNGKEPNKGEGHMPLPCSPTPEKRALWAPLSQTSPPNGFFAPPS